MVTLVMLLSIWVLKLSCTRELDLRVGKVASDATIDSSSSFTISLNAEFSDISSLNEHDYLCIVDNDGKSVVKNIVVVLVVKKVGSYKTQVFVVRL